VFIQGRETRVYPTGAFVGLVPLREGKNGIKIAAKLNGRTVEERLEVNCVKPVVTSPVSPLTIDRSLLEPSVDMALQPGEKIDIMLKGSPGMKARWSLDGCTGPAPLHEIEPAPAEGEWQGVGGIYRGTYRVRRGDRVKRKKIKFSLVSPDGKEIHAFSKGRITLLPGEEIRKGAAGSDGAVLSGEMGGRRELKLAPGTRVNVCGEGGKFYRVMLSRGERYWAPRDSIKIKGEGRWAPVKCELLSVSPAKAGARLIMKLGEAVPWKMSQPDLNGPLLLRLYGVVPAGKEIDHGTAPPVGSLALGGDAPEALLKICPGKSTPLVWGYSCGRSGDLMALDIMRGPGKNPRGAIVVVDPGHGGRRSGAVSPTGLKEKDINLTVAGSAVEYLKSRGVAAVLTREGDTDISLKDRSDKAKGAAMFVSIHHNSQSGHEDPLMRRGAYVYYGSASSKGLAETVMSTLAETGVKANGVRRANYAVLLPTEYPAVLVECCYMSHPGDEAMLLRDDFLRREGQAIGKGIIEFIKRNG